MAKNIKKRQPISKKGIIPLSEKLSSTNQTSPIGATYGPKDVKIDKELQRWIVEQDDEAIKRLEQDCVRNGIEQPIDVWINERGEMLVVDGFTRHRIAERNNLRFKIRQRDFPSKEAAKVWMIENQTRRRNLNPMQRAYYIGWEYSTLKKDTTNNLRDYILSGGQNVHLDETPDNQLVTEKKFHGERSDLPSGQNVHLGDKTAIFLANVHKLGNEKTVRRYYTLFKGIEAVREVNQVLADKILKDEVTVNQGVMEKLGMLENPPTKLQDVDDILKAVTEKKKKEPSTIGLLKKKVKLANTKVNQFVSKPSEKNQQEAISLVEDLLAELKKHPVKK